MSNGAPRNLPKSVTIMSTASHTGESGSCEGSIIGMDSLSMNGNDVLPEQWTLPKEWNIEMRQMYDNWKLDLQTQISQMDKQLYSSLQRHPDQQLGQYTYNDDRFDAARRRQIADELIGKMSAGLKRD